MDRVVISPVCGARERERVRGRQLPVDLVDHDGWKQFDAIVLLLCWVLVAIRYMLKQLYIFSREVC